MARPLFVRGLLVVVVACGGAAAAPPAPPPAPTDTAPTASAPAPTASTPPPSGVQCSGAPPAPDYKCVQDCGPPVARAGDPPPPWHWLSPADAKNRESFGCPICLPPSARIATPDGDRPISELTVGARVLTVDEAGRRVEARVLYTGSTPAGVGHRVVRLTLADGRVVTGSGGHPIGNGRTLGEVRARDALGGSVVVSVEVVPFTGDRTWDILPSGPTGLYVADGVVLQSTFFGRAR